MAVNDVYRVDIFYQFGSELTQNVIHLKETTAETDSVPASKVSQAVHAMLDANLVEHLSEGVTIPVIRSRRILPTPANPFVLIPSGAPLAILVGQIEADPLPAQCAALFRLTTQQAGKSGQGRIYIPGFPELYSHAGRFPFAEFSATELSLINWADDEWDGGSDGRWELAVYSRALNAANLVEYGQLDPVFATQRGRRHFPGYGPANP